MERGTQGKTRGARALSAPDDLIPVGSFVIDEDGTIGNADTNASSILGVSVDDLPGRDFRSCLHPASVIIFDDFVRRVFDSGRKETCDVQLLRNRENVIHAEIAGIAVRNRRRNKRRLRGAITDISVRKETEAKLHVAASRYRIIADNTYDWEIWIEPGGQLIYSSPSCKRITGHDAGEFMADPDLLTQVIHPDDRDLFKHLLSATRNRKVFEEIACRIVLPDDTVKWVGYVGQPVFEDNGRFIGTRGSIRDITIRKRMEEELRLSEELFRSLSDSSPIGIFLTDTEGLCLYANSKWREIAGLELEECLGDKWSDAIHPADRNRVFEEWNRCVGEGRAFSLQFRFQSPQGIVRWVHSRAAPVRSEKGDITGYVGTDEDITERKKAEESLQESRRMLQLVLDTIPVRVFWKDRDSRYLGCNRTFREDAGLSPGEEIAGKNDYELVWRDQAAIYRADDRVVMEKGLPMLSYEEPQTLRGAAPDWLRTSKVPLHDGEGRVIGVLGTYEDITDRKHAEERQAQLIRDLEKANRELDEFAHIISHDLKAPLRAIASLADWIAAEYRDRLDEQGREKMMILTNRVIRLHDLVDAVLAYSRAVRDGGEPSEVDLNSVIPAMIDMLSPPKHITITVEGQMPRIVCDRTRIEQVFLNLLSNAIQFMDKPRGEIRIRCVPENDHWKFSVSDNGPGIEKGHLFRIFRLFETSGRQDMAGRTGIGLAVVKKIVEMYGGTVWAESDPGRGSTFFFTVPQKPSGSH